MEPHSRLPHAQVRQSLVRFVALVAAALLCGCSSGAKLVPVTGTVKLDGKPVDGTEVIFWSTDESTPPSERGYGRAITDASGNYVVKDLFGKDGLFIGEYKVTFNRYVDSKGQLIGPDAKGEEVVGARNTIPKRYQEFETTPEVARVPSSGCQIEFNLKSK